MIFFNNLINTPMPNMNYSPANSSSAPQSSNHSPSQMNFANLAPIANPYFIPPEDPRSRYQHQNWYQQQLWYPQTQSSQQQQNWYPQTQYPQTPLNQNQFSNVHTPPHNVEAIAESEPVKKTKKGRGKKVAETSEREKGTKVKWTGEESKILAERWVDASQNGVIGNSQSGATLWRTIYEEYNKLVDVKRNMDQLTGKWNKLQKDVKLFQSIHKKLVRDSGTDDVRFMLAAREAFKDRTKRNFSYEATWLVLKDVPKFYFSKGVMTNKRSIEDEDEEYHPINLEDDDTPNPDPSIDPSLHANPNFDHLFQDDPIRRPPGRGLSRKSQRSSGSSDATSSRCSDEEVRAQLLKTAQQQQKTMETIAEAAKKKLMFKAFKVLNNPVNQNLPPEEQAVLNNIQDEVKRDYFSRNEGTNED